MGRQGHPRAELCVRLEPPLWGSSWGGKGSGLILSAASHSPARGGSPRGTFLLRAFVNKPASHWGNWSPYLPQKRCEKIHFQPTAAPTRLRFKKKKKNLRENKQKKPVKSCQTHLIMEQVWEAVGVFLKLEWSTGSFSGKIFLSHPSEYPRTLFPTVAGKKTGAREDGHVPGLRRVPGTGHQCGL